VAGVGKSRIAREALASAANRGIEIHWAAATASSRTLPLGAFASWASAGTDDLQLVRGVIDALTAAPADSSVIVSVDDVHLLDDLSAFVVHQIAQRRTAKLVLTVRDGEAVPGGLQELWNSGEFERLDLQPLSQHETTQLLSTALDGPIEPDAARRLWALTHGNVLYLRNIVEQEVGDGRLAHQHGYWRWTGDPVMPPSLVALIESRIGTLPSAVGDVLDALAVGEPLHLTSLSKICDPAAIEDADVRGLISLDQSGEGTEVRVAHPLYGEIRRKRGATIRLRRLRGLIATELATGDDDMRTVVRRAALSVDSDLPRDPDLLVRAAHGATWLADLKLADRLADSAVRAGAGADAYFIRAHALSWLDRGQEADALLAELSTTELSDDDRARLAYLRANNMFYALANPAEAKHLIDAASDTTPAHARGCIDAFLTAYWFGIDEPEAAMEAAKDLEIECLPAVAGSSAAWAVASVAAEAGHTGVALAAADAGYAAAARSFDTPHTRFNIADACVTALLLAGDVAKATTVAEEARLQAADLPGIAQALGAGMAGRAALGAGQLDDACALLSEAVDALCAAGHSLGWGYRYQMPHSVALAMRGLGTEAAAAFAAACEWQQPWRLDGGRRAWDNDRHLTRAWVAACQGAISEAIGVLFSSAETARAHGQFAAEVVYLQTATQFGDRSCAARLRALEALVDGPRAGLAARFAAALEADDDAAELSTLSEEFEKNGDRIAAIDAAAHAAAAYRRQGMRGSGLGCSTRAEALAQVCGGASTPALQQVNERVPFTDREREIVMLIRQGLSTRAIAERLTLSVRTVEGHIYRAMDKTGVARREDLAALVPSHRPPVADGSR
jgi:DNA-binding CsgD family transcriptional regulator